MIRVVLLLFCAVLLAGCNAVRAADTHVSSNRHSDRPTTLKVVAGGMNRRCDVYNAGSEKRPLVILIHCSTDTSESAARCTGFSRLATREGFILAVPEVSAKGRGWTSHPAIFDGPPPADDIGFFRYLIAKLKAEYAVDPKRIYLAGQLSGGMMAYRLAADMSDEIAAIGVVNGSIGVTAVANHKSSRLRRSARPVPIIAFHGWANDVLPYDGGEGSRAPRSYVSVNETMNFWRSVNKCTAPPVVERFGKRATVKITYPADDGTSDVVLYKLPKANHEWPGAIVLGSGRSTPAELMWSFFEKRTR